MKIAPETLPPLDVNQRYHIDEARAYLRIGRSKFFDKLKTGELRVIKDGKQTLVPGSEIARLSRLPEEGA